MKTLQILNKFTGNVIFEKKDISLRPVLEAAVKQRIDLTAANLVGANLVGANLKGANLACANLTSADLEDADLEDANLEEADLKVAYLKGVSLKGANLKGANLEYADLKGAYLKAANLTGANFEDANLTGVNLTGVNLTGVNLKGALESVPIIKNIHRKVYEAACVDGALDMRNWHCGTTHCRAGFVTHLSGEGGKALERALGTSVAAALIYMASDPTLEKIPDFYCSNDDSLADMKRLADMEVAA